MERGGAGIERDGTFSADGRGKRTFKLLAPRPRRQPAGTKASHDLFNLRLGDRRTKERNLAGRFLAILACQRVSPLVKSGVMAAQLKQVRRNATTRPRHVLQRSSLRRNEWTLQAATGQLRPRLVPHGDIRSFAATRGTEKQPPYQCRACANTAATYHVCLVQRKWGSGSAGGFSHKSPE